MALCVKTTRGQGVTSAARPGGVLKLADAFLDLALILGLGQLPLSHLSKLDHYCSLEKALDEAHEFSWEVGDSAIDDTHRVQPLTDAATLPCLVYSVFRTGPRMRGFAAVWRCVCGSVRTDDGSCATRRVLSNEIYGSRYTG